jgi:hypothetical protein
MIQNFIATQKMNITVSKKIQVQYLQILHATSRESLFTSKTTHFVSQFAANNCYESVISDLVILIISNQLQFMSVHKGTIGIDIAMADYLKTIQSLLLWTPLVPSQHPLTQLVSHLHICMQICNSYFRMQFVKDYSSANNTLIIDDFVTRFMGMASANFSFINPEIMVNVLSLMSLWIIEPGRKQSVAWFYLVFSILCQNIHSNIINRFPELVDSYIQIIGLIAPVFRIAHRNTNIQVVSDYVASLLTTRIENSPPKMPIAFEKHVYHEMMQNGYLIHP